MMDIRPGHLVGILVAILAVFVLVLVGIARPAATVAAVTGENSIKLISVSGQGKIRTAPDTAYVDLGVITEAPTAKAAAQANTEAMNKVVNAVKTFGIQKEFIKTSNYRVEPVYRYDTHGEPPALTGYKVYNTINVTTNLLDKLGQIIDAAVDNGSNNVGGIRFGLKDEDATVQQAIQKAMENARAKADTAARAAGVRIKGVHTVKVETQTPPPRYVGYEKSIGQAAGARDATPIESGEVDVIVNVSVDYEL